ncbi:MAG: CDP-alcohol phosphatidyltransferase family protein [Chloroflexi bacterium]|nr:CDP-alcohol phosphatidyltransferase family protein [Chloroflexota bacterium]
MMDSFSSFERRFVAPYRTTFARITAPLVRLLRWLHVSPNLVSFSQVPIGGLIVYFMGTWPQLAFSLFVATLLLDSLDGALARAYGRSSQFGALFDQLCDHTRETLMIAAVALQGDLHLALAVLYPLVYATFNFLLFLCNYQRAPVPWAVKSYLIVYPGLFLYTFFQVPWMTPAVALSLAFMTTSILLALRNLSRAMG